MIISTDMMHAVLIVIMVDESIMPMDRRAQMRICKRVEDQ